MVMKTSETPEQIRPPRRQFTSAFRADVVKLCQTGDESVAAICRRLNLSESAVYQWVKLASQNAQVPDGQASTDLERQEFHRLRRENKQLRMEREILKKAVTFFAKENT